MSSGILYVVATPIGNLEDLSPRAARLLREATVVAAEDTRSAQVLLRHADAMAEAGSPPPARRKLISVFEGNEASRGADLAAEIANGADVVLISEAGTPAVSDPGARVVAAVIAAGGTIVSVPGPSAALAALVASGLPADRFLFIGFPPREEGARQELLGGLVAETATIIFYEAPDRVARTLRDVAAAFGADRQACVSREISKVYEEHARDTAAALADKYASAAPRGECTIVVAGSRASAHAAIDLEGELRALLATGLGPRDAAARLVVRTGKPRRELYQLALSLRGERPAAGEDAE